MLADRDQDLTICTLQHRVDELLADNDNLRVQLLAKDRAIVVLTDHIADLEESTYVA